VLADASNGQRQANQLHLLPASRCNAFAVAASRWTHQGGVTGEEGDATISQAPPDCDRRLRVSLPLSSRHLAILAWSPDSNTRGPRARNSGGGVTRRAQSLPKKSLPRTLDVRHCPGQQTDGCVYDRERGASPRSRRNAEGDLLGRQVIGDALIDVLVVTAEESQLSPFEIVSASAWEKTLPRGDNSTIAASC